jgi:uncharacterized membrane protein
MSLPSLVIPNIPLPFEIPQMLHPLFVHFAIALPVVIIILEVINLATKRRTIGILSFFFMLMLSVVLVMAYLTGVTDGQVAKATLGADAKEILMSHKQLGVYLVYSSILVLLFKLIAVIFKKPVMRVLFFLVIIVFTGAVFNEGKKGGELVYMHGVNVKATTKKATLIQKDDKITPITVTPPIKPETPIEAKAAVHTEVVAH